MASPPQDRPDHTVSSGSTSSVPTSVGSLAATMRRSSPASSTVLAPDWMRTDSATGARSLAAVGAGTRSRTSGLLARLSAAPRMRSAA